MLIYPQMTQMNADNVYVIFRQPSALICVICG